jgi:hypothetical protein
MMMNDCESWRHHGVMMVMKTTGIMRHAPSQAL